MSNFEESRVGSADRVVISLADPEAADPNQAGGKGANLAELVRDGLPVPAGFVVSTAGYRDFVREHHLDVLIQREMARLDGRSDDLDATSERLRRAFEGAPIPAWLGDEIAVAYSALGEGPVAVRSSATAEDLPGASFAGQQDTVLNVVGAADLCDAVRRCWSSVWTARAISYRQRNDIVHERVAVAVVVQRMVPADVAGVLFTADPVSGRRDHTVIEAAAGLGEAVVSGRVTPDRWTVDRRARALLSGPVVARPSLTRHQVDALVGLGSRAADLFGVPQDIEWAVSDGRCWLLQSRPITSLFPLPPASEQPGLRVYIPTMLVAQGIVEPMTPAGNVFFRAMSAAWMRYLLTGSLQEDGAAPPTWLPVVAGRIYLDATPLLQRPRVAAKLVSSLRMKDPIASAVLTDWLVRNRDRLPRKRGRSAMRGLAAVIPSVMSGLIAAFAVPTRTRRRLLSDVNERLARLEKQADALTSPQAQIEFVDRILPAQTCELIVDQLSAVYAEELTKIVVERLLERWLGTASDFEPVRRWLPHDPTIAMGAELARLARDHAAAGTEPSAASPEVAAFLAAYGHRAPDREIDLGLPRFADDPTYVVELIRGYMGSGEPGQTMGRFETGAAQAVAAIDNLVAKVQLAKGRAHAAVLRALLGRYREVGGFRERPKFDMVRAIALGRRTLRRAGATLVVQGLLDDAEQVFFLDTADVRAALTGAHRDLRELATSNQREFDRELRRRAVPRILVSDGETVYGPTAGPLTDRPDVLVGTPISPGVHEGLVRVLDSPVNAKLQPGEILVAASTDPGWTPLFLLAGALIMEVGGVVSHGAVVAREYGIPAVAGIAEATTRLRTGQRVRVEGGNGTVTLLQPTDELPGTGSDDRGHQSLKTLGALQR